MKVRVEGKKGETGTSHLCHRHVEFEVLFVGAVRFRDVHWGAVTIKIIYWSYGHVWNWLGKRITWGNKGPWIETRGLLLLNNVWEEKPEKYHEKELIWRVWMFLRCPSKLTLAVEFNRKFSPSIPTFILYFLKKKETKMCYFKYHVAKQTLFEYFNFFLITWSHNCLLLFNQSYFNYFCMQHL